MMPNDPDGRRERHHVDTSSRNTVGVDSVQPRMSLRTAVAHRNLLYLLSLKELRTRYRKSVLGWAWTLLNPLSQMVIFSIVFLQIFNQPAPVGDPSGLKNFPLYLLCGLLPFQFFSISVTASIASVSSNAGLITKVAFPHEHLALSIIIAQLVTFLIEILVLAIALLVAGQMVLPWLLPMLVVTTFLTLFTTGISLALSAANVFFHDVNYLWSIVAQVLFYASPIIWFPEAVGDSPWLRHVANFGPTGTFVRTFQELLYEGHFPSIWRWGYIAALSLLTFAGGSWIFSRLSPRFAEEL